jgi:hypothetical protein
VLLVVSTKGRNGQSAVKQRAVRFKRRDDQLLCHHQLSRQKALTQLGVE